MTALLGLAALDFGRLLVVAAIAQLLERAFLVELLLQTAQGAVDDFTFFDANFGIHADSRNIPRIHGHDRTPCTR